MLGPRVADLLEKWRRDGVQLRAENGSIVVAGKKGALTPDIAAQIRLRKSELLVFLTPASAAGTEGGEIPVVARTAPLPLSSAQQRLWYIDLMVPGSSASNLAFVLDLPGPLEVDRLQRALDAVFRRHEILRTSFALGGDGEPHQILSAPGPVALPVVDLSALAPPARAAEAERLLELWARQPLDLGGGPLVQPRLLRMGAHDHRLSVTAHQIVFDASSQAIFVRELQAFYQEASPPPPLVVQYGDYGVWQRRTQNQIHLPFWKEYLRAPLPLLDLPTRGPRPAVQSTRGDQVEFRIAKPTLAALNTRAGQHEATLFMTVLAAWKVALARFTGQDDLVVGTPIENRARRETAPMIGLFANTVAVRTALAGDPGFSELLDRVRLACLAAFAHQDTPFDSVVEAVNPARDTSRTPIYQTMFALNETPIEPGTAAVFTGVAPAEVSLSGQRDAEGLRFLITYNLDLFERSFIEQLAAAVALVLDFVAAGGDAPLAQLPVVSPAGRAELLTGLFPAPSAYPSGRALHQWFEAIAAERPSAVALRCGDQHLTYAALEARANQLAHHLRAMGLENEGRVAVAVPRSLDLVVALLGVLKAGGAYVPLDPSYPPERLAHMLEDSGATVLVLGAATADLLRDSQARRLSLELDAVAIAVHPESRPRVDFAPHQLAYVIYTSGSTGKPKGVMIEHHNTANLFTALGDQLAGGGVWFSDTSISFDISVLEIFGGLGHGFEVVLRTDRNAPDEALPVLFERFGVTHFQCTPSQLSVLLADAAGRAAVGRLQQLIVGGEALPATLLRALREILPGRLINDYGPTETTVWSTTIDLPQVVDPVPIGKPIANTRAYVLDSRRELVPRGVIGELWLGGAGVGRGYHNRPDLTQERFLPDPFIPDGARIYATGDKVRWLADGTLEYRGRGDAQVKIRGHRIELGEIESALRACPGVEEAAVVVREDAPGLARLIAFFTVKQPASITPAELRGALKARLPEVMIPESFNPIERMPLSPGGKVDRIALSTRTVQSARVASAVVRPRNAVEAALAMAFASVLQVPEVGVDQNFFELGGHSLLVVNLVQMLRDQHGIDIPVGALFSAPTVAELAAQVRAGNADGLDGTVVPLRKAGANLPFFCICGIQLYQPLVDALGDGQPAFGVFVPAEVRVLMEGGASKTLVVRTLAAAYIKAIRKQQPRGPYCLGGLSFGGVLAFEVAHQLVAAGEEIRVLALFDTVLPRGLTFAPTAWVAGQLKRLTVENALNALGQRLRRNEPSPSPAMQGFPGSVEELSDLRERLYMQAMTDYDPTMIPFPGQGLLFCAQDQSAFVGYDVDRSCGWTGLFQGGLKIHEVPGNHIGIVGEKFVRGLAATLRGYLDEASARSAARNGTGASA